MPSRSIPPGPKGTWPFGTTPLQHGQPLEVLTNWARQYGDVVSWRMLHLRAYLLNHPDDIETVLVTRQRSFIKGRGLRANREALGDGLLTSEGSFWLRQRRLIQPAFRRERVMEYAPTMAAHTMRMLGRWQDGDTRDVHHDLMRLTLEIAAETLFGMSIEQEADRVGEALEVLMEANTTPRRMYPLVRYLPTAANRRYTRAVRELDRIVYGIIARKRSGSSGTEKNAVAAGAQEDLLSSLLNAADDDGSRMTDRQLRDECMTLLLAGHETTALALSWTCYLLANHPEVQTKLHAELDMVCGTHERRTPSPEHLHRLPLSEAIVRESLRLYPPAWLMPRLAIEDCEIGGYRIPKGASVVMSQWIVHRDPRYFADPNRFDPARWTEEFARSLPRFAYFPFGGGPRICVGSSFAMMETVLLLAIIAQGFRFSPANSDPVEPVATMTLRPKGGVHLTLSRR